MASGGPCPGAIETECCDHKIAQPRDDKRDAEAAERIGGKETRLMAVPALRISSIGAVAGMSSKRMVTSRETSPFVWRAMSTGA